MKHKVSISIGELQEQYGDREALRLAKEMGADAVDFNTCGRKWDYRNPDSVYSKSDDRNLLLLRRSSENTRTR